MSSRFVSRNSSRGCSASQLLRTEIESEESNYVQLLSRQLLNFTLVFLRWFFFSHLKFNNTLKKWDNLALRANMVTWYVFSQRYVTWNQCFLPDTRKICLFFGIHERKLNIWRRNGRETISFFLLSPINKN